MENYLKQLENWVLDEGKIVTIEFMIRSTPLNAMQIQSIFDKLLKEHPKLNSTYFIIGQMGDGPNQRKKCLIVKNNDLEHVKNQFDKITLCNINSIHKIEMKDPEILFNADWVVENEITMENLKGRAFITSATAEKCYQKVKIISENIEPLRHDHDMPSPEKWQNQELPTKDEPPTKTIKMEKQQTGGGAKKAAKPATQMKISNFFTRE